MGTTLLPLHMQLQFISGLIFSVPGYNTESPSIYYSGETDAEFEV